MTDQIIQTIQENLPIIEKVALGTAILYCWVCGKQTIHWIFKSDRLYEDYECPDCHKIEKIKVK